MSFVWQSAVTSRETLSNEQIGPLLVVANSSHKSQPGSVQRFKYVKEMDACEWVKIDKHL